MTSSIKVGDIDFQIHNITTKLFSDIMNCSNDMDKVNLIMEHNNKYLLSKEDNQKILFKKIMAEKSVQYIIDKYQRVEEKPKHYATRSKYIPFKKTEKICMLKYVPNEQVSDDLCYKAVCYQGLNLKYVKDKTNRICEAAVKNNGLALKYVDAKTLDIYKFALNHNGMALEFVDDQTEELCLIAVRNTYNSLRFVKNKTDRILIETFQSNVFYKPDKIESMSENVIIAAIISNPDLLEKLSVEKQTKKICYAALNSDGLSLKYIKNQTKKICKIALKQNGLALEFVKKELLDNEIYEIAIRTTPKAIKFVQNKTIELCALAMDKDISVLDYIDRQILMEIK